MKKGLSVILVLTILLSVMMIGSAAAEEVKITGAGCSPSTVGIGENALLFVWTSLETRTIALFGEDGNQLCDWPADAHSVKDGKSRVWNVIVPTDMVGANTVLVKASADGVNFTKEYKVSFTVTEDAPERISSGVPETTNVVKLLSRSIEPYEMFFVDVYTSDNAKVLALVGENGEVLQSWKAEESARYQKAGQCIWTVMLRPNASGELRYTFCASEDGETYGSTMSTTVTVNALDASVYSEYLGTWYGVSMTEGGETYALAELGMDMTLEINADGSASMDMAGDIDETVWQTDNGCIIIEGAPLTLNGDTLTMRDYGSEMVFSRESASAAEPTQEPAPQPIDDIGRIDVYKVGYHFSDYMGTWYGARITEDGQTYDLAELGMSMTLTLDEDCHVTLDMAGDVEETTWENGGDCIIVEGAPLTLDGDILMMQQDGTEIVFSREAPTAADLSGYGEYLGDWHCISMTENDETMNPAEYGMQIVMTLNADGSAILDMAGDVETAAWSPTDSGVRLMTMEGIYLSDGTIVFWMDGTKMVFSREALAAAPADDPTTGMPDPSAFPEYLGEWYCISMTEGGETASPAEYGMEITLTLNADAFAVIDMSGDVETTGWSVIGNGISVMGLKGTLQEDGTLILVEESTELVFSREKPEGMEDGGVDMSDYSDYIDTWFSEADGMTVTILEDGTATVEINGDITNGSLTEDYSYLYFGDAMLRMQYDGKLLWSDPDTDVFLARAGEGNEKEDDEAFDMTPYMDFIGMWGNGEITLTLTEDGKAELAQNGETRTLTLGEEFGYLKAEDLYLILQSDGTLSVSGSIYAVLYRDGIKPTPKPLPTSATTPEPASVPTPEPTPMPMPTIEPISIGDRMNKRFVCVSADMEGYTLDASMLGGEYAMTFHADARMDLVLAGMEIPGGCAWETAAVTDENGTEQTAFQIDYFGMTLTAVLTDTGFEMNYMDTMLMYFEIEE